MKIFSHSLKHNEPLDKKYAFGQTDPETHVRFSNNISPHIKWQDFPDSTQSFAVVLWDRDVPSIGDNVNQEGKIVSEDLPRVPFYHWVVYNIPVHIHEFEEGFFSKEVTPKGKPGPEGPLNTTLGINNYTQWFQNDQDMKGHYFGYDGPCPPWNDPRTHHYELSVYALNVKTIPITLHTNPEEAHKVIQVNCVDKSTLVSTYSLFNK